MLPIITELVRYASVPIMVEPQRWFAPHERRQNSLRHQHRSVYRLYGANCRNGRVNPAVASTTPAYIAKMKEATRDLPLYQVSQKSFTAVSSSTRTIILGADIHIIGECINPTTNPVPASLRQGELSVVTQLATDQKKDGAHILDNLGLPDIDELTMMQEAVDTVSRLVDCPLQIDSSNPK